MGKIKEMLMENEFLKDENKQLKIQVNILKKRLRELPAEK